MRIEQINKDTEVLHDLTNDFYESHFDSRGRLSSDLNNAIFNLMAMQNYINDLLDSYQDENGSEEGRQA